MQCYDCTQISQWNGSCWNTLQVQGMQYNVLLYRPLLEFRFPLWISYFPSATFLYISYFNPATHIYPWQLIFPLRKLMFLSVFKRLLEQPKYTKTCFAFHNDFNTYMYNWFLKFDLIGFYWIYTSSSSANDNWQPLSHKNKWPFYFCWQRERERILSWAELSWAGCSPSQSSALH